MIHPAILRRIASGSGRAVIRREMARKRAEREILATIDPETAFLRLNADGSYNVHDPDPDNLLPGRK
jgi:hypothetical protein